MGFVTQNFNELYNLDFITPETFKKLTNSIIPARGKLAVFACRSGEQLAKEFIETYNKFLLNNSSSYKLALDPISFFDFRTSESKLELKKNISGRDVIIFQSVLDNSTTRSVNDNYMELFMLIHTAKLNGANKIMLVVPHLPYDRQDKPSPFKREPITIKMIASILENLGVTELITIDPHFPHLQGYFNNVRVYALSSMSIFKKIYSDLSLEPSKSILVSPDTGYVKELGLFSKTLGIDMGFGYKIRPKPGESVLLSLTGNFNNKSVAIIKDDIVDSAGTVLHVAKVLASYNNINEIYLMATHPLLNSPAIERIKLMHDSFKLKEVHFLNTVIHTAEFPDYVRFHSISETLVKTVNALHYSVSVSKRLFPGLNN